MSKATSDTTKTVEVLTYLTGGYMPGDVITLDSKLADHYIKQNAVKLKK